jgi:lysophospholipase L1-like esterase
MNMTWIDRHPWFSATLFGGVFFCISIVVVECYLQLKNTPGLYEADSELGWTAKKNYLGEFRQTRLDGSAYLARVKTDQYGLRRDDVDSHTKQLSLLIMGDSYTMDPFAANSEMWWSVGRRELERELGLPDGAVSVAAAGAGGYGTLQNLLLLQRLKLQKMPAPDIFVLQFCSNDFVNNHREWESSTIVHNQSFIRPYYQLDGGIKFSENLLAPLWRVAWIQNSRLFLYLDSRLQGLFYRILDGYHVPMATKREQQFDQESLRITGQLLRSIRAELGDLPAFMVNCDATKKGLNRYWEMLASQAGFIALEQPANEVLANAKSNRAVLFNADGGHFSPEGNQVYGNAFAKALHQHIYGMYDMSMKN